MTINNIERARRALFSALGFIALLLCGAVLLGLGLAESAEGAGIRAESAPAQILPDAVADAGGAPEMVADAAESSNLDIIETTEEDCERRGGVINATETDGIVYCAILISQSSASAASAAEPDSTGGIDFQDDISKYDGYGDADICRDLGGTIEEVTITNDEVCSEIDQVDTFCIVGSTVALPCQGLFKHVRLCNGAFNRRAWDMFFCGPKCSSDDEYACGAGCERGGLAGPVRIPYVAPGYVGEVFRVTLTMDHGNGRVSALAASGFDARVYQATGEKTATVHILSPLPTVSATGLGEHAVTLRAGFSCAGQTQKFGAVDSAYTITALPPFTIQLTREWLAPDVFATLTLTLSGLDDIRYSSADNNPRLPQPLHVKQDGGVGYSLSIPESAQRTFTVNATSPGRSFLGMVKIAVEVTFAGPPNASRMPLDCRAPNPYAEIRLGNGCGYDTCGLDDRLRDAVTVGNVDTACERITEGANVNHETLDSKSLLFDAVERGDAAMVSILAYNGADVNYRHVDSDLSVSDTPLHVLATHSVDSAAEAALEKIARALVENGADVNARDEDGATYLYLAASGENASGMRAVLRAGADPNLPIAEETDTHRSFADFALVRAADDDRAGVVSILLEFKEESGLDVNITEELRGLGALHVAESVEVARLLARAGADVNLESAPLGAGHEAGLTPLEWQARQGRLEVAEYIHSQGGECPEDDEDLEFCP